MTLRKVLSYEIKEDFFIKFQRQKKAERTNVAH